MQSQRKVRRAEKSGLRSFLLSVALRLLGKLLDNDGDKPGDLTLLYASVDKRKPVFLVIANINFYFTGFGALKFHSRRMETGTTAGGINVQPNCQLP